MFRFRIAAALGLAAAMLASPAALATKHDHVCSNRSRPSNQIQIVVTSWNGLFFPDVNHCSGPVTSASLKASLSIRSKVNCPAYVTCSSGGVVIGPALLDSLL